MVGCNAPMLERVVISVGAVPQSRYVSFPDRIATGISGWGMYGDGYLDCFILSIGLTVAIPYSNPCKMQLMYFSSDGYLRRAIP